MIIGWRGSPKIKDEPQHEVKGKITEKILKLLNIKYTIVRSIKDLKKFDKQKDYVRKWVPEFDSESYVDPIIDHKYARERCLNAYKIGLNK